MGYRYDVFISYKSGPLFGSWVIEYFYPMFEERLKEELAGYKRKANIFLDKHDIPVGTELIEKLKQSVAYSRCLVAIWSPKYFYSKWCMSECAIMLNRQHKLGYPKQKPEGLILPVVVKHGENYPEFAENINWFDCTRYARTAEGFRYTPKYVEFEEKMIAFVANVAKSVCDAPAWNRKWLEKEWIDEPVNQFPPQQYLQINQPVLE